MKVNTDELNRQAAELRRISARINDIEDALQRVNRGLCRERFGEKFRSPLDAMARTIAGRMDELNRMSTALLQISTLYERTENRILDEAEHANVHYDHELLTLIPIPTNWFYPMWYTRRSHYRYNLIHADPVEDVMVVNGLPTLNDIGWEAAGEPMFDNSGEASHNNAIPTPEITEQMLDVLWDEAAEMFERLHGRGYNPPGELPDFEPINLPLNNTDYPMADRIGATGIHEHADMVPGFSGLIDWTPWDA